MPVHSTTNVTHLPSPFEQVVSPVFNMFPWITRYVKGSCNSFWLGSVEKRETFDGCPARFGVISGFQLRLLSKINVNQVVTVPAQWNREHISFILYLKAISSSGVMIGPADHALQEGGLFLGVPKFHLSNGRRKKKIIGAHNSPNLVTVDGQKKIIGVYIITPT